MTVINVTVKISMYKDTTVITGDRTKNFHFFLNIVHPSDPEESIGKIGKIKFLNFVPITIYRCEQKSETAF